MSVAQWIVDLGIGSAPAALRGFYAPVAAAPSHGRKRAAYAGPGWAEAPLCRCTGAAGHSAAPRPEALRCRPRGLKDFGPAAAGIRAETAGRGGGRLSGAMPRLLPSSSGLQGRSGLPTEPFFNSAVAAVAGEV